MKKKNQTRIREEFKTGSSHVATRLYTTSRPFLPLLGDYSRRCEGFKLADEMRFVYHQHHPEDYFFLTLAVAFGLNSEIKSSHRLESSFSGSQVDSLRG